MDRDPFLRTNQDEAKKSKLRRAAGAVLSLFRHGEEELEPISDPYDRPDPFKPQIDVKPQQPKKEDLWDDWGVDWEDPRTGPNGLHPRDRIE